MAALGASLPAADGGGDGGSGADCAKAEPARRKAARDRAVDDRKRFKRHLRNEDAVRTLHVTSWFSIYESV
jgi:hypothetical protein